PGCGPPSRQAPARRPRTTSRRRSRTAGRSSRYPRHHRCWPSGYSACAQNIAIQLTVLRAGAYCERPVGTRVKQGDSVFRVLIVEDEGLGQPAVDGILKLSPETQYVRAGSLREARRLLQSGRYDLVVADESRLRRVIDSIFTVVGLFSLGGIIIDVNEAPLAASTLRRDQVLGHRFVDMPWFAHSATERVRIADAIERAGMGQAVRIETWIRAVRDGRLMCMDAAFAPL